MHPSSFLRRAALLAGLVLLAAPPRPSLGSPTITPVAFRSTTQGTVGEGWTGPIQFVGTGTTDFLAPGILDLGEFHLQRIPSRTTLGVEDLPFEIQLWVWKPGSGPTGIDGPMIHIEGRIDGSMKGTTESTLVAQVTSISAAAGSPPLPFDLKDFSVQLPQTIRPYAEGPTRVYGYLNIPEPSAVATLLAGGALLLFHRRRRLRRSPG
jgi:hypothetical protein